MRKLSTHTKIVILIQTPTRLFVQLFVISMTKYHNEHSNLRSPCLRPTESSCHETASQIGSQTTYHYFCVGGYHKYWDKSL